MKTDGPHAVASAVRRCPQVYGMPCRVVFPAMRTLCAMPAKCGSAATNRQRVSAGAVCVGSVRKRAAFVAATRETVCGAAGNTARRCCAMPRERQRSG